MKIAIHSNLKMLMLNFVDVQNETLGRKLRLGSLEYAGLEQLLTFRDVTWNLSKFLSQGIVQLTL